MISLLSKRLSSLLQSLLLGSLCCCSVAKSCPAVCNPKDYNMPSPPSLTTSQSLPKFLSIESVMPFSHLILCHLLLLLPLIFPIIRIFSNEPVLPIRWPKYWHFSFSIIPSKKHPGLISFRMDWLDLQPKGLLRVFSNTTVQKHQFFGAQLSSQSNSHIHT